jgi:hypothetical protein
LEECTAQKATLTKYIKKLLRIIEVANEKSTTMSMNPDLLKELD